MTRPSLRMWLCGGLSGALGLGAVAFHLLPSVEPKSGSELACEWLAHFVTEESIQAPTDRTRFQHAFDECRQQGHQEAAVRLAYTLFFSYWSFDEYRNAFSYCEIAMQLADQLEDDSWQPIVLGGLFTIQISIGDMAGAEATLQQMRDSTDPKHADQWATVRSYDGYIRMIRGEFDSAARAFLDVLAIAQLGDEARSNARFNLIEIYLELGRIAEAELQLQAVLDGQDAPQVDRETYQLAKSYYRALVAIARGDYVEAETLLRAALDGDGIPIDWEWQLEQALGRALVSRGDTRGAIAAYERAIVVIEALRTTFGEEELQDWMLAHKREPYESLFVLQAERGEWSSALEVLEQLEVRSFLDAFIQTSSVRAAAAAEFDAVFTRAETLPSLARVLETSTIKARLLPETQSAIEGRHVLIYLWADAQLWLVTVGSHEPKISKLSISPDEFERQLDRLIANPDDEDAAAVLGSALLPLGVLPERGRTIHFMTDGSLGELPFASLMVAGRRLVVDHPIAYAPSLSALVGWSGSRTSSAGPPIVLGDSLRNLPNAASETVQVAALLVTEPYLGTVATRSVLDRASVRRSPVLHVATHAGNDSRGPWLELADGRVYADEILEMKQLPDLVVLASCVSGARPGDTMWGSLGAAFLAAGSRTVVATLWSVDDEATRRFVLRFYDEGGMSEPAAALARTQRAFLDAGEPASTWAPFVVLGSG